MSDARSHRRLPDAPLLVAYTIGGDFAAARTETYDIGLGGLAMLCESELPAGQSLRLELELRGDPRPPLRGFSTGNGDPWVSPWRRVPPNRREHSFRSSIRYDRVTALLDLAR